MTTSRPHRVLLVDDHPLLCEGLAMRLGLEPDLLVCGVAHTRAAALTQTPVCRPDVAIVDLALEDGHGLALIEQLRDIVPGLRIVVLSAYDEELFAERALRAGAAAYLNKRDSEHLVDAVRAALAGRQWLSAALRARLRGAARDTPGAGDVGPRLSAREIEVLTLVGRGLKTGAIAARLGVSVNTVDSYRAKLKQKLDARDSGELSRLAVQWVLDNA